MNNLSSFGVQELNAKEIEIIDGGGWIEDAWNVIKEIDAGWDRFKERLANGYNSYQGCSCH